jgi:hypothetical protein
MIYFLLPKIYFKIYEKINSYNSDMIQFPCISNSLSYYLCDIKEKINIYEKEWDNYKKYTNAFIRNDSDRFLPFRKNIVSASIPLNVNKNKTEHVIFDNYNDIEF